ncbi:uncharacterized protein LOC116956755 [Petromyzon marinus]|uniref:uncharacterized protein LOC116956755 n=1 Tax=Petromyzon marinus TaxID=7757 RepID=UPI003F6E9299
MAESLEEAVPCGFSLLLPARPLARLSEYAAVPQRLAAFHGEVVPLVFVVRYAGRRRRRRRGGGEPRAAAAAAAAAAAEGRESSDPVGGPLGRDAEGGDEVTVDDDEEKEKEEKEDEEEDEEDEEEEEDSALRAVWSRISPELRASAGVTSSRADRRDGTGGGGGGAAEEDGQEGGEEGEEGGEEGEEGGEEGGEERPTRRPLAPGFRHCRPLLMHGDVRPEQLQEEEREVLPGEVIFSLRVRLDKLPIGTTRAKVRESVGASVWLRV